MLLNHAITCRPAAGAEEDFAEALGGAAPSTGGRILSVKGNGSKSQDAGPSAQMYKKDGHKKQKQRQQGGKPAKRHKEGGGKHKG